MKLFANMGIGKRLAFGFATVLALLMGITALGVARLGIVASEAEQMMSEPLTKERLISDWNRNIATAVVRTTAVAKSNDPALAKFFAADASASAKSSSDLIKKIEPLISAPEERSLFDDIVKTRKAYTANRDEVMRLKAAGNTVDSEKLLVEGFVPVSTKYLEQTNDLLELQRKGLDRLAAQIDSIAEKSRSQLYLLASLAVAFGVAFAWFLTTGITRPMRQAVEAAKRVAGGDLTVKIDVTSTDETGQLLQSLQEMSGNLHRMVSQARSGTDAIATAAGEIASGNIDLSSRTEQQASSLEEVASSMEEITATVRQNADNARQANTLAINASETVNKGSIVVADVVDTMGSINESAKKIADIISVIDGIAFQTNILSLNAAVEAARAGEQGRGFAVVATEVRTLARRSAEAAKEIKALINDSVEKVGIGSKQVEKAGQTMQEILESVQRVTDIMGEITSASQEQSAGIEQVNQAIGQMDEVTQQNAALVEQAAAASQAMEEQAAQLRQAMSAFKLEWNVQ
jgi:methyl-accepting chemotaxis protein